MSLVDHGVNRCQPSLTFWRYAESAVSVQPSPIWIRLARLSSPDSSGSAGVASLVDQSVNEFHAHAPGAASVPLFQVQSSVALAGPASATVVLMAVTASAVVVMSFLMMTSIRSGLRSSLAGR